MRIKINEAIEFYNLNNPGSKMTKRKLAGMCMPGKNMNTSQGYLKRLNDGNLGRTSSVNMDVIKRILEITGVSITFIFDL